MHDGILVSIRPIDGGQPAQLILQHGDARHALDLSPQLPLTITLDTTTKYCTGWYDIATHTAHLCNESAIVDTKHEQCYVCRQRTDFNPAFYNTTDISDKQAVYNNSPHSVYIAYFGDDLAKAGISADSRGLRRLREQGALFYAIIDSFPNAQIAHYYEDQLIAAGLRNSVSKRQKAKVLEHSIDQRQATEQLKGILAALGYADRTIVSQLDDYFYGTYPKAGITTITNEPISGTVCGVVGRYLVFANNDYYYGVWLDTLLGYRLTIDDSIVAIISPPTQTFLF